MRFLLVSLLTVSYFVLTPNLPGANHDDFTGAWRLDTANSPTVEGRTVTSGSLSIEYRHKMIHLSETMTFPNGDKTVAMEWRLDHKYHPVTGAGTGEYLAKWEGSTTLTAEHEMSGDHESIRLAMSPDGRTLTETIHHTGASGAYDRALIWKR